MWSSAWLAFALPGRSRTARISPVLSHHTPSGWKPKPPLKFAAACSFSECAVTSVASTSNTTGHRDRCRPPGRRQPAGQLRPHVPADPGPGRADPLQRRRVDLVQRPPHRRRRRDRTPHRLVTQRVDVGDRLTAGGEHGRHVDQHPPTVMHGTNRRESTPPTTLVSPTRSASSRTAAAPASGTTPVPSAVTDSRATTRYASPEKCSSIKAEYSVARHILPGQEHFSHDQLAVNRPLMHDPG